MCPLYKLILKNRISEEHKEAIMVVTLAQKHEDVTIENKIREYVIKVNGYLY